MHPILGQLRRFIAYLLGWIPLAGMLVYLLAVPGGLTWTEAFAVGIPLCLVYALMCLSAWYSCRGTPLDRTGVAQLALTHVLAAVVVSGFWVLLAKALAHELSHFSAFRDIEPRLSKNFPLLFGTGILLYLLAVAFQYVLLAVQQSQEAKEREMKAGVLARDAELRALKAQVNPHFLFNSLNSISALTSSDPAKAREMCILLGDFLRRTLGLGEKAAIPLEEELSLIRAFLTVEKVRFGARIQMVEDIDKDALDVFVPPLLLQPLVENAVVHGISNLVEGGSIKLDIHSRDGALSIVVENSFDPDSPPRRRGGVGLANVRQRLATRHGNLASFEVKTEGDRYRVAITLPAEREARAS
ncbi:MAG: sensor histidine kinase [Candidatus Acidiferrales bacterium]